MNGATREYRLRVRGRCRCPGRLFQIAAKALNARAGFLKRRGRRRIGNAERRTQPERRALHHGDSLGLEKFGDEILVGRELLAGRRHLTNATAARRVDVEGAFRLWAAYAIRLVEHGDAKVAALLEDLVMLAD